MSIVAPLPIAVPLVVAALLGGMSPFVKDRARRAVDAIGIATAAATAGLSIALLVGSGSGVITHWFGGWTPHHGVAVGIDLAVDPVGAGVAALAAVLATAALVFSWHYFEAVGTLYHTLVLVFLAGMSGFALTGDLFDMFVFFELMSVSAYALTAYRIEDSGPIAGAINFGVTNSCGAFLLLTGIAMLYGRTGALNLEQIGQTLAGHSSDALVAVALVLVIGGFLVKASIVPFHFWLADAHAVAPTPVCVLFSGVMVELGVYAVARIVWTVFTPALGSSTSTLRAMLLVLATLTAFVGAVMCLAQRHIKRLLAFSTIAHSGVMLGGVALLSPLGLAATGVYVLGHGLVKGSLFLGVGVLLHRTRLLDEGRLRGEGRRLWRTGLLMAIGGLALAGLPPFGIALGKGLLDDAASSAGAGWFPVVTIAVSVLTGAAVLRMVARVFLGAGAPLPKQSEFAEEIAEHEPETPLARRRTPLVMAAPSAMLLVGALVVGLAPRLVEGALVATTRLAQPASYAQSVLGGAPPPGVAPAEGAGWSAAAVLIGLASTAAAIAIAAFTLYGGSLRAAVSTAASRAVHPLRAMHSGHIGDYVAWLAAGVATLGVVAVAVLR